SSAGLLYRIDAAASDDVQSTSAVSFGEEGEVALTSAGGRWAVLDAAARILHLESGAVGLDALGGSALALQEPSATGDRILVASTAGLLAVPAGGGDPEVLVDDAAGAPARPLVLDGCAFAGWAGGSSWRQCEGGDGTRLALQGMAGAAQLAFAANG